MNEVQIAIIGLVVTLIIAIVAYHFYQERKFKDSISRGFNQSIDDALNEDNATVLESRVEDGGIPFDKDIFAGLNEVNEDEPKDLLEVAVVEEQKEQDSDFEFLNNAKFDYKIGTYVHVIDVAFADSIKFKLLPDLTPFCSKGITTFVLERNEWLEYEKGKKYNANGIRILIGLINEDGVVSPLQLSNVYNELTRFIAKYDGKIRQTNSEEKVVELQKNFKKYKSASLELELFVVNHDYLSYNALRQIFVNDYGLIEQNGIFYKLADGQIIFYITNENSGAFESDNSYRLFAINSKLHHFADPMIALDALFDLAESYQTKVDSRLLTSNKMIMKEYDYKSLIRQIELHFNNLKRNDVEPGSELVKVICP